ncbi:MULTISPECIES: Crp/Fnr family transcriptional regulator [unclassified Mesorhizobium]|uniref:Crp/Fnr family transcriptional regulator n=1 Tax=unclassified Mesorhizobium TaxID=325217 RepID=UPI001128C184|nr:MULTISPECIES: Crp/Fnr family transcriptional regulator [unclassified Mesorhizobium]TPK66264.1 Crp/Fnr family transcriptional regulator [Mesorhizobium sp. B2-5-1]TPM60642.1 Crp/Fnr family transcriptional regulator [Mesorhizobium sp. B2-1-9]TPM88027.1 Crp/Fnr family transcriptional regulator [Mesorhizobium sp. B2-1-4]TPN11053.1 Crp/Fnr family transcriptional regulator [Mesorhizobium sp. B2-1-2]UCI14740.1 Crp/Fnr family transcriptional regulator [Mesorhizobium sp. B2-1-1]
MTGPNSQSYSATRSNIATNSIYRNALLLRMCSADLALLHPHLTSVSLGLKTHLEVAGSPIKTVYFFESGLGSVVGELRPGIEAEIGVIGSDGMSGSALVMGDDRSTHDCYVQLEARAFGIDAGTFTNALLTSPTLRTFLLRYVHYFHLQASFTALTNARMNIVDRLSRWLVMCDDRVEGNRLSITHDFLSVMLGVRRPGVTIALQTLEGQGLIRSNRGEVVILDRARLIALADGSYGRAEAEYVRLIGQLH